MKTYNTYKIAPPATSAGNRLAPILKLMLASRHGHPTHHNLTSLTMKMIRTLLLLAALTAAFPTPRAMAQIYVTSGAGNSIDTANLDGSNPSTLLDFDALFGNARYDPNGVLFSEGQLFWTDADQAGIYAAGVDGSNPRKLVDLIAVFVDADRPVGIVKSGSQLIWADRGALYTVGLDGSNPRVLIDLRRTITDKVLFPFGITVVGDELIWTASEVFEVGIVRYSFGIFACGLDGSNPRQLIEYSVETGRPAEHGFYGIVAAGTQLFWADKIQGAIYTAGLDGSNPRVLIDLRATFGGPRYDPEGIVVFDSLIYWTDDQTNAVYTAGLDGSNPTKLFDSPTGDVEWIAIAPSSVDPGFIPERLTLSWCCAPL